MYTYTYMYIYTYMRKHSQHNIRTSMNEGTHYFIKNIPLTFNSWKGCERVAKGLRKGWCWLCVRGELETGTNCNILTQSSSCDHSSTSSSFWLGCSTVGHWGPEPSVWSWFSLRGYPISSCDWNWPETDSNWLTDDLKPSVEPGYIIVWHPPASCGHTHLHRIQPHPQVKVIFRYLRPDAPVSLLFCLFIQVHLLIDG